MKAIPATLLALTLALAAHALKSGDAALFLVRGEWVEPVALLAQEGGFLEPPAGEGFKAPLDVQAWLTRFFKPGTQMDAFLDGRPQGTFSVGGYTPPGCSGFGNVSGKFKGKAQPAPEKGYLAFSPGFPGSRTYAGGQEDPGLRQLAVGMSLQKYALKGVPAGRMEDFEVIDFVPFTLNQGRVKAFAISSQLKQKDEPLCASDTLLLVAEKSGGRYENKVVTFYSNRDNDGDACQKYHFISTLATGSCDDKFLLSGSGYEWNWYEIYQREQSGRYRRIYQGGGGGC